MERCVVYNNFKTTLHSKINQHVAKHYVLPLIYNVNSNLILYHKIFMLFILFGI